MNVSFHNGLYHKHWKIKWYRSPDVRIQHKCSSFTFKQNLLFLFFRKLDAALTMLIMARISSSPLELHSIYSIRCNKNGPLFCHQCESCKLVQKINLTKAWFIPLSYNSKRMFLERLIVLSDDMHTKITSILSCLHSKDFQYSNSRVKCGTTENGKNMIDKIEENTNHSLDIKEVGLNDSVYYLTELLMADVPISSWI